MASVLLFVYGTLKRAYRNHPLLSDQEFVGDAQTLPRYRLLDSGPYPCLVESAEGGVAVDGELWRVEDDCLRRLDRFEEVPEVFERRPVQLADKTDLVFAYFYRRDTAGFKDCGNRWPADQAARRR